MHHEEARKENYACVLNFVNRVDLINFVFVGLFTLLMYDFGVKGVEVEEVYDLTKPIDK